MTTTRRRSGHDPALPHGWTVRTDWAHNGRNLAPGTELSIRGERGRFRFIRHVTRPDGVEWVDMVGGPAGHEAFRSFRPDRIRTVHRLTKARPPGRRSSH